MAASFSFGEPKSVLTALLITFHLFFQTQRDSLRVVKEQMKQTHEEEINSMIAENEKLQGLLDTSRRKQNEFETEIEQLKATLSSSESIKCFCNVFQLSRVWLRLKR